MYRSVKLAQFAPLAAVPGVRLYSLQKGTGAEQLAAMEGRFAITDLAGMIASDFRDTAAAIEQLDLVIAVDTSVAHLAGALGRPVWVLLPYYPDWRWRRQGADSPWYPTARLFRQQRRGDWDRVFGDVATALAQLATEPRPTDAEVHRRGDGCAGGRGAARRPGAGAGAGAGDGAAATAGGAARLMQGR
jgi:hypothetical protein